MRFALPSRLITTVVAATITVTSIGTTPAYADRDRRDDNTARAIGALLGIAAIGVIIHESKKDKKSKKHEVRRERLHEQRKVQQHRNHRIAPKQLPRRVSRNTLPQDCLRTFRTRDGRAQLFGQRCLQRNYAGVNRLPQKCFQRIRTRDGHRAGYGARCLSARGYQLSRR